MDKSLKVSVLMPVYNASPFLREAIESVINQSFTDFEFLLINDGSTDNSAEIIDSYHDSRIRHICLSENSGIIMALNYGLEIALGEYLVRMDADDMALPERIAKQVKFMADHPEIGASGTWVEYFGTRKGIIKAPATHEEIMWAMLMGSPIFHPSSIIRTETLKRNNIKYSFGYPHAEDYALWAELLPVTKLANIPEVLLKYRWSGDSITVKNSPVQTESASRIRRNLHELLLGHALSDSDWNGIDKSGGVPLSTEIAFRVYSDINQRNRMFTTNEFKNAIQKRIKQLIQIKGVSKTSRKWLLRESFKHVNFFKYLVYSYIGKN